MCPNRGSVPSSSIRSPSCSGIGNARTRRVQVFDRSPLCTLALSRFLGQRVTPVLADEIERVLASEIYQRKVFLVRPLGFITATAARTINYEDSLRFEAIHEQVYREHGFDLIDIPATGDAAQRATAIEAHLTSPT